MRNHDEKNVSWKRWVCAERDLNTWQVRGACANERMLPNGNEIGKHHLPVLT